MEKPAKGSADHCMGVRAESRQERWARESTFCRGRYLEAMRQLFFSITSTYMSVRGRRRLVMPISCP